MSDPAASDDDIIGKAYDARLMRRLLGYLRPHWRSVLLGLVVIIITSLLQLVQPWLTKVAIDEHIARGDLAGVGRVAALFLAVLAGVFVLEFAQTWISQTIGQGIMFEMRMAIYGHLQRVDVAFYDRHAVGRLMTRVTSDVDALNDLFSAGVVAVFGDAFMLAGIVGVVLWMDWRLALVTFSVLPLIVLVTQWFRRHVRESYRRVRGWVARINAFLQENLTGMATVQLFRRETLNFERFEAINRGHRDANVEAIFYYAVFYPAIEAVAALAAALIIVAGGHWVGTGTLDHRRPGRLPAVRAALLPADQRHVGEVQPAAGGDGVVGADLHAARHAGHHRLAGGGDAAPARRPRPHRVRARLVRLRRRRRDGGRCRQARWL